MIENIFDRLEEFHKSLLQLEDFEEGIGTALQNRLNMLADEVPMLIRLASVSKLVKHERDLPVRRITYNVKKLSGDCTPRWNEFLKLNCDTQLFLMLSFNGLSSLPDKEFNWLVENTQEYLGRRAFRSNWILRDPIRRTVVKLPLNASTQPFLRKYHNAEIDLCEPGVLPETEQRDMMPNICSSEASNYIYPQNNDTTPKSYGQKRIRQYTGDEGDVRDNRMVAKLTEPSNGKREMKYMFTNAPVDSILVLPEQFKRAIQNSSLWKWERSQQLSTTGCLAVMFPKDDSQDVSFTFWCGHDDGYFLNDLFKVQCALSS
ncbi:hypothetical protein AOCH_004407 [Aspergillus ochraceoroseus]|uniref:Uncharacterized protein n=1 Tax=Aspergillus ochraceoroseus TaxID=138278 RepID=A0A0F8UUT7_9EURO|nr:hypothetical protein AOCH_004407 [Aspergillus ochraceoroseus]